MKKTLIILSTLFFAIAAWADPAMTPPQQTVLDVSTQLRHALKEDQAQIQLNPKKELFNIVKTVVLPCIDIDQMVDVVLGREGHVQWKQASLQTRQEFVDQFVTLIIGTYSAALQQYDNQPVQVFPVRGFTPDATMAEVHSAITRDNGQVIQLLYNLQKEGNEWKVTDFSVEGISLIQSYQAQFQSIVQSDGLTGLIATLKKHNASNHD